MFAGALNKGIRGAIAFITAFFLLSAILSYFAPKGIEVNNYPNLFYNFFAQKITSKALIVFLNYLFIGVGGLIVSLIAVKQEVVEKQNYFPVFIYLAVSIASITPTQLTPQAFTNVFVLFATYKLLDTYREESALNQIFEAAFWLCVSAFITISSIISFPLFFITLLILRPFYWREWAVAILGFLSPIILYESIAYLSDFNQWYFIKATELFFDFLKLPAFSEYYLPLSILLFILFLISLINNLVGGFGNTVKKQRTKSILLWYVFLSGLGFFSGGSNGSSIILTYALPLSFFIGDFLYGLRQIKITNTILTILMLCVILVFLAEFNVI
ncbi:MAG: beta-carotene 15,15-monooxygenase [Bacteroidetes bacterium]|nr:beta-carotene 15,15-monooxygenase [Bacteroidota bacterium]